MSSFQKRKQVPLPPGTMVSIQSKQPVTSSGIPSLDHILGGGLTIGSVLLVEEDKFNVYSKVLAKYFLAEGIFSKHKTLLASLDDDPQDMYKKVPSPSEEQITKDTPQNPDDMRIAWRYNNLPQVNSEQNSQTIGHNFDLTKPIQQSVLDEHGGLGWDGSDKHEQPTTMFSNPQFESLLHKIAQVISQSQKMQLSDESEPVPCVRICLTSFGSPLWFDNDFEGDFIKFLTVLKAIVRSMFGVCMITAPMHLLQLLSETIPAQIRNLVDYSVQLEAFAGSDKETNPIFKEYHGLLNINKISALNTLNAFTPETTDLAFKLRRRKFVIEKLHLPPELQENEEHNAPSLACGDPKKHLLEF